MSFVKKSSSTREYDVIVIGSSFAGLSFAVEASKLGLSVCVIEKDEIVGKNIRTTGIFTSGTVIRNKIPKKFCTNGIKKIKFFSPSLKSFEVYGDKSRVYMSRTGEYLRFLAKEAQFHGTVILTDHLFISARYDEKNKIVNVKILNKNKKNKNKRSPSINDNNKLILKAKYLIGADGCLSKVAKECNLGMNEKKFVGKEFIVKEKKIKNNKQRNKKNIVHKDEVMCFYDYDIAPGYCAWIAPNKDKYHIGIAGDLNVYQDKNKLSLNEALERFLKRISKMYNVEFKIIDEHGGLIPVGGIVKKVFNSYAALTGDAAGVCGPLTLAGIPGALESGRILANAVKNYIITGNRIYLKGYVRFLKSYKFVKKEYPLKVVFNIFNNNKKLDKLFKILSSEEGKQLIKNIILEKNEFSKFKLVKYGLKIILKNRGMLFV